MKKVFYFLMSVVMLAFASCTSCKHDPVEPVFNGYDFEQVTADDYQAMVAKFGEDVRFYEVQVWYNKNLDVVDSNYIAEIRSVYQYVDTSVSIFHFADTTEIANLIEYSGKVGGWYTIDTNDVDYTFTLYVNDFWVEDQAMSLDSVKVTLDSALNIVRSLEQPIPQSNFVVMRQPLFPPFPTHPYYIFGTMIDCIGIDAMTGEVVTEF